MGNKNNFLNIAAIYDENLEALYSYALHLGFEEQTSMDAIHDVFYKICIMNTNIFELSNIKSYLFRAVRNRLIDIKRGNRISEENFEIEESEINLPFQLNVTVEDEFIEKEDSEEIKRKVENVLNNLTDRQREIVFLRYIQEHSYEEIAEIMNMTIESSRNLISRSLLKLKETNLPSYILLFILH